MGWKGIGIGAVLGALVGRGLWGAVFGAWIGHTLEERGFGKSPGDARSAAARRYAAMSDAKRAKVFCATAAAMLAKMAKADGRVTSVEIDGVEDAFRRLGFSAAARAYAVDVFRRAKDDGRTIFAYAEEFATAVDSIEVRELFYEILWDIACADGRVSAAEYEMLRGLPRALRVRDAWFTFFASSRLRGGPTGSPAAPGRSQLDEAYAVLGARASDSDEEVRRKYRELAKRNHPDALRAQGLPEAMVGKATERMSRINAAWATVRSSRGLS